MSDNKDIYVSFDQAKKLKEIGFPQRQILCKSDDKTYCVQYSESSNGFVLNVGDLTTYKTCNRLSADSIEAPTIANVRKWFIDEFDIHICPMLDNDKFLLDINYYEDCKEYSSQRRFDTYENAFSFGLDYVLDEFTIRTYGEIKFNHRKFPQ